MRYSSAPLMISILALGCSADVAPLPTPSPTGGQGGGSPITGGSTSGGASPIGQGGVVPGSGGASATTGGATTVGSGGTTAQGGSTSGGQTAVGGSSSGGAVASGGAAKGGTGSGGQAGGAVTITGGVTGTGGASVAGKGGTGGASGGAGGQTAKFSFFVTSIGAMRELSNSQDGFGGDLRFGEATGLAGADKICRTIAEKSMAGAGQKEWRAFLSTAGGTGGGTAVNAIDRVGNGPWYDRLGRIVAMTKADLLNDRPKGADPAIINDLPNENGVPNHLDGAPGCTGNACPDNHDTLTGTGKNGMLYDGTGGGIGGGGKATPLEYTCKDWTSSEKWGKPWCGHSWPRQLSGVNWMSALAEGGCAPGVNLAEKGGPEPGVYTVGTGGGYGGIYCFALTP